MKIDSTSNLKNYYKNEYANQNNPNFKSNLTHTALQSKTSVNIVKRPRNFIYSAICVLSAMVGGYLANNDNNNTAKYLGIGLATTSAVGTGLIVNKNKKREDMLLNDFESNVIKDTETINSLKSTINNDKNIIYQQKVEIDKLENKLYPQNKEKDALINRINNNDLISYNTLKNLNDIYIKQNDTNGLFDLYTTKVGEDNTPVLSKLISGQKNNFNPKFIESLNTIFKENPNMLFKIYNAKDNDRLNVLDYVLQYLPDNQKTQIINSIKNSLPQEYNDRLVLASKHVNNHDTLMKSPEDIPLLYDLSSEMLDYSSNLCGTDRQRYLLYKELVKLNINKNQKTKMSVHIDNYEKKFADRHKIIEKIIYDWFKSWDRSSTDSYALDKLCNKLVETIEKYPDLIDQKEKLKKIIDDMLSGLLYDNYSYKAQVIVNKIAEYPNLWIKVFGSGICEELINYILPWSSRVAEYHNHYRLEDRQYIEPPHKLRLNEINIRPIIEMLEKAGKTGDTSFLHDIWKLTDLYCECAIW
ncbi:MAG: hypothetical protein MJ230_02280 [bacterium]|nr:hypothetical protein [bacterium]